MTPQCSGMDAQGNRIDGGELFWCPKASSNEPTVFFHIGRQLIRRRVVGTDLCLASDDDDISTRPVPIKMKGCSGVLVYMLQAFGIRPTIHQNRRGSFIPQKPHRRGLWHTLRVNGREPD